MNASVKVLLRGSSLLAALVVLHPMVFASVDDAQSFALQAAEPYVKEGFQVREDYWGGDLGSGEKKAVRQQLFKGNEYWFWSQKSQIAGKKVTLPPRTSFQKQPAATL